MWWGSPVTPWSSRTRSRSKLSSEFGTGQHRYFLLWAGLGVMESVPHPWSRVYIWALPFAILEVSAPEESPELARVPGSGEVLEVWCCYAIPALPLLPSSWEGAGRILCPRCSSTLVSGIDAQDQSLYYQPLPKYSRSQCGTLVRAWAGILRA